MIKNELQLKKLIKNILLKEEYQIDDFIELYSNDIDTAIHNKEQDASYPDENITKAIRKNNALLEIIFELISVDKSEKFKTFYEASKIKSKSEGNSDFYAKEDKHKKSDFKKIKIYLEKFIEKIQETKSAKDFNQALTTLKNNLSNYIPKWTILQYLFLNIKDDNEFTDLINEVAENDELWQSAKNNDETEIKTVQYLKSGQTVITQEKIIEIINKNKLNEKDKRDILSNNVSSPSFMKGIKRGEWNWLTDTIDDTAKFFFPNLSSITTDIENWFDDIGRALGKDPDSDENWLMDYLVDNPEIKKYLKKVENGDRVSEDELEDILNKLEEDRNSDENEE